MKTKIFLLTTVLIAGSLAACDKNDDSKTSRPEGEQTLVVQLPRELLNLPETRAIEDPQQQGKTTVDDVTVFLMIGETVHQGTTHTPGEFTSGYIRYEQVPGNINNVIVVVNKVGEEIKDLKTATAIRKYAYTVASQHLKTGLSGRTLMGEGAPVTAQDPNPHPDTNPPHEYKKASVDLHALTSRIEVGAVKMGTGLADLKLLAVYINNYYPTYAKSSVIRNVGTDPVWGVTNSNPSQQPGVPTKDVIGNITINPAAYSELTYVNKADDTKVYLNDASKAYAFHTFSGNVPHLILLVKGEYAPGSYEITDDGDHLKYFYGWVTYTKFKISEDTYADPFLPNKIYKMGVGATGITINHTDIFPEPEITPYDLGIQIEVLDWTPQVVTPEL